MEAARRLALRLERRELLSVRTELLISLYLGVATLLAGVGWLVRENLERIGPLTLLGVISAASAICYAWSWRVRAAGRERSLGEDYLLLLGALLASVALGYAEAQFHLLGTAWSRHLLLLAAWHFAGAYLFGSRLVLSVALTAFAAWLGVEVRPGTVFEARHAWSGPGSRALLCALLFWTVARVHGGDAWSRRGFREVYRQFAANLAFLGTLALVAQGTTRWIGVALLLALATVVGRTGFVEKRESFVLYAVGYAAIGLVWFQAALVDDARLASCVGLVIVVAAVLLLLRLRARLKESTR